MEEVKLCKLIRKCRTNSQGYCDDEYICGCENCINLIEEFIPIENEEE